MDMELQKPESQQQKQKYISYLVEKLSKGATEGLDDHERIVGAKYLRVQKVVGDLNQALENLAREINQKQQQLQQLQERIKSEIGRASGVLDALLELKFPTPGELEPLDVKGNGTPEKTSKKNKKAQEAGKEKTHA